MAHIMFVNPLVEQPPTHIVLIEDSPSNASHGPDPFKVGFPIFITSKFLSQFLAQFSSLIQASLSTQVLKVEFVESHPIELPPQSALQLSIFRGSNLSPFCHFREGIHHFVRIGYISLIESKMVFEQGLAEPFHPDEFAVIFCRVVNPSFPLFKYIENIIPNKFSVSREFFAYPND